MATIPAAQAVDANGRTIEAYGPSVITTQVLQSAANGTSNGADFDITGSATLQLLVSPAGSYTGTVTFNASPDGTNFDVIQGNQQGTSTLATSVTCSGNTLTIWTFQTSGLKTFRASIAGDSTTNHVVTVTAWASNVPNSAPLAATITSTVLAAGSNIIGKAKIVDTAGTNVLAVDSNNNAAVSMRVGTTPVPAGHGVAATAMRVELPTDGTGVVGLNAGTNTIGNVVSVSGTRATYTYAISATAPYATPTDWIVIRGSATKTVKILRIELSGAATAATEVIFTLKKHTVANTGGTSTTPTPMQHDSADGAATAVALLYSVAPTIDATATIWKNVRMTLAVAPAASTVAPDRYVYDYGVESYEPLTLRGVAQEFAINFGGSAVPSGGVYDVAIVFSEE
jgi:hypothetical protein